MDFRFMDMIVLRLSKSWVGVGPSPHDPFALSAPTLRRGVSKGPHNSVFGVGPTPPLAGRLRSAFDTRR